MSEGPMYMSDVAVIQETTDWFKAMEKHFGGPMVPLDEMAAYEDANPKPYPDNVIIGALCQFVMFHMQAAIITGAYDRALRINDGVSLRDMDSKAG